jgi:hypothetical protein
MEVPGVSDLLAAIEIESRDDDSESRRPSPHPSPHETAAILSVSKSSFQCSEIDGGQAKE